MKKIYKTVKGYTPSDLDSRVESYLEKGYQLYGNPYSYILGDKVCFVQAMIYVDEEEPKQLEDQKRLEDTQKKLEHKPIYYMRDVPFFTDIF